MHYKLSASLLILLSLIAGCTIQQQPNGKELEFTPPSILADQSWQITRQGVALDGAKACTLAGGDVKVILHAQGSGYIVQVAAVNDVEPGDYYKVIIGSHIYETPEGFFSSDDSKAIIRDFSSNDLAYTELRHLEIEGPGLQRHSYPNKIPLAGFGAQYQQCERFIRS